MSTKHPAGEAASAVIAFIFSSGILSFTMDAARALLLGVFGAAGGILVKVIYNKYFRNSQ